MGFVRKQDFRITVGLNPDNPHWAIEFADAIYRVRPSFLVPRVVIEVYQPIVGNVHDAVIQVCKNGLRELTVATLIPNRPDLVLLNECGHLSYLYTNGTVLDQETIMSKDAVDGDDFMVHLLSIEFQTADILTNELVRKGNILRPLFGQVRIDETEERLPIK